MAYYNINIIQLSRRQTLSEGDSRLLERVRLNVVDGKLALTPREAAHRRQLEGTVVEGNLVEGVTPTSILFASATTSAISEKNAVGDAGKEGQRTRVIARLTSLQVGTAHEKATVGGEVFVARMRRGKQLRRSFAS